MPSSCRRAVITCRHHGCHRAVVACRRAIIVRSRLMPLPCRRAVVVPPRRAARRLAVIVPSIRAVDSCRRLVSWCRSVFPALWPFCCAVTVQLRKGRCSNPHKRLFGNAAGDPCGPLIVLWCYRDVPSCCPQKVVVPSCTVITCRHHAVMPSCRRAAVGCQSHRAAVVSP